MWTFDLDDEPILPPEIEEKYDNLDDDDQQKFLDIFSQKFLKKVAAVGDTTDEDENLVDKIIEEAAREAINEFGEPEPIDNWKNGLDLL